MRKAKVRKGMPSVALSKAEFTERFKARFYDPVFAETAGEIEALLPAAWTSYHDYHKAPRTRKAGRGFADPSYDLSVEWLAAHDGIKAAEREHRDPAAPSRVLIVNGSMRSDQTCPGEISKSWRLAMTARKTIEAKRGFEVQLLDLSRLASEYGRVIYPCKACVSTAMPLCHWPCSCYPNHAIGQVNDWMNEIYPMWVKAHGVMIVTPVNWYQVPAGLKAMIDRLVCADGGNPDPTSTHGKDPEAAKALELKGWPYPRHLAGRLFSVITHGDASGTENLRRILTDWLTDMGLVPAGSKALLDRYIGYYRDYATSHDDLDADLDLKAEVRNAAETLVAAVRLRREGRLAQPDAGLKSPRPK
ncbi:MAG: flavodoxin family protein [Parvibaculaceae bacterium]